MSQNNEPNIRAKGKGYEARMQIQGINFQAYASTKQEAVARLKEKVSQSLRPPGLTDNTFRSLMEGLYLPTISNTSKNYQRDEMRVATLHMPWYNTDVSEISRQWIQNHINRLPKTSPKVISDVKRITRSVLKLAVIDGILQVNPAEYIKLPKRSYKPGKYLTAEELRVLIAYAVEKQSPALPAIVLTGLLGIGWEEIRDIEPKHFNKNLLTIVREKTRYRRRIIPVPNKVLQLIKGQTFPLLKSDVSTIYHQIEKLTNDLGMEKLGRNILRHTCATGLQELNTSLEIRAMILGHTPPGGATRDYSDSQMIEVKSQQLNLWVDTVLSEGWEYSWECRIKNQGEIIELFR
jgi:integrase